MAMNDTRMTPERVGLCFDCVHGERVPSARGAVFLRCGRADEEPEYPKYPRLPVLRCVGYEVIAPKSAT